MRIRIKGNCGERLFEDVDTISIYDGIDITWIQYVDTYDTLVVYADLNERMLNRLVVKNKIIRCD